MTHEAVPVPVQNGLASATTAVQSQDLQNNPTPVVTQRRDDIDAQLVRIGEVNRTLIGRWTMSRTDKELALLEHEHTKEALSIIRLEENAKLKAFAAYSTRWMEQVLHHAAMVGESNLSQAARLHFNAAQGIFHGTLLRNTEAQFEAMKEVRVRAEAKGDSDLMDLVDHVKSTTKRDFFRHVNEFSAILEKAVAPK